MSKLVVECHPDGQVFVMEESEKHHRKSQRYRTGWERRTLESMADNCVVEPGQYLVMPLVEV